MGWCHKVLQGFMLMVVTGIIGCKKSDSSPPSLVTDPRSWVVSTVAGTGYAGYQDGPAETAQFAHPYSIAVDSSGNLFVGGSGSSAIRKISNGQVTTFFDSKTGNGNAAFNLCYDFALDHQGNVYNVQPTLICKINQWGTGAVFAGGFTQGFKDGQDTEARFNKIVTITRDEQGNFYLPDYDAQSNFQIRKVSPAGKVTTIFLKNNLVLPLGSISSSNYGGPIAVDKWGNIYVTGSNTINKIDPQGNVSLLCGNGYYTSLVDGVGRNAQFGWISGMVCDSLGNLYVCDWSNSAVRMVMPDGRVITIAGSSEAGRGFKDGKGPLAQFHNLTGITIDKKGALYVADTYNNRIRKLEYK